MVRRISPLAMTRRLPAPLPSAPLLGALLLCALILVAAWLCAPPASAARDLGIVVEAMDLLRFRHWNTRLDMPSLVRAGVSGLRSELRRSGAPGDAVREIPAGGDLAQTVSTFGERLDHALWLGHGRVGERDLIYAGMRAMMWAVGSSHTYFLTPEQRVAAVAYGIGRPTVGIGVSLRSVDGQVVVSHVITGSPADRAGVRRGDIVVMVDSAAVDGRTTLGEVARRLAGPEGTSVRLTLRRASGALAVEVARAAVAVHPAESLALPGGIVLVRLNTYALGASRAIEQEIARVLAAQPRALIVDLRGHSGGFILEFVETAGFFVARGTIVMHDIRRDGNPRPRMTAREPLVPPMPAVVLIDRATASAGELTAALFKEHLDALLVGERTAGVLETGMLFPLSDESAVNISVSRSVTGKGIEVEGRGYPPDIEVPLVPGSESDMQLERAIQVLLKRLLGHLTLHLPGMAARAA